MPTLTEEINLPSGVLPTDVQVEVQLWGVGAPVTGYEQGTAKTIAGRHRATGNPWSIANIVANTDIDIPTGTTYKVTRSWPNQLDGPLVDYITMPSGGGPYRVDQVLTATPASIPSSVASSEVARWSPASNSANIAVVGITLPAVPLATLDIPDLSRPVLFLGSVSLSHTTVANAILYAGISSLGDTALATAKGLGNARAGAANTPVTCHFIGRVPAHSAGTYQVGVNGDAGDVVVAGGGNNISHVVAVQV